MNDKKKILFVITKGTWGGAQRYVFDLATTLPKEKFEPIVAYGTEGKLIEDLRGVGIQTHHLSSLGRDIAIFSDIKSFFQTLRLLIQVKPHVVHVNSSKAAALGALAATLVGVPRVVFTVHGWPFKENRNLLARLLFLVVSWLTALWSDTVIVVSKIDQELGERMWFLKKKIRYVPLGVSPQPPINREAALYELRAFNPAVGTPEGVHLGTIAELHPNKGIANAIKAVAILVKTGDRPYSYTIVGSGEERPSLEKLVESLGIKENVHFTGFIPNAPLYVATFDVFLLPSLKEGMPYVLIETGDAGIPTVTTNVINPDLTETYKTIVQVDTVHPKKIAAAIIEANSLLRQQVISSPKFPLDDMVKTTVGFYS